MTHEPTTIPLAVKNVSYIAIFLMGLPLDAYAILVSFMCLDIALGVTRSVVLHGPRSITSRLLTMGVVEKAMVLIIPALIVWTGRGAGIDLLFIGKGALSILVLAEAYSILGNIQAIRTKKDIKEYDAVTFLLKKLRDILEKLLKNRPEKGVE